MRLLPISLCLTLLSTTALATDWTVATGGSIQNAIDQAQDGDVIYVEPGEYQGGISFRGKAVSVISTHGAQFTKIDSSELQVPAVTVNMGESVATLLKGFELVPARILGGGARIQASGVTLEDIVVFNVESSPLNTMFNVTDSEIVFRNLTVTGYVDPEPFIYAIGSNVSLSGCSFNSYFRAIHVDSGVPLQESQVELMIEGCVFNTGVRAIYAHRLSKMEVLGTDFYHSGVVAHENGPAFYSDQNLELTVEDCSFFFGRAQSYAGSCLIQGNTIHGDGFPVTANFARCSFEGDFSGLSAGSLSFYSELDVFLADCIFESCQSNSSQGAAVSLTNQGLVSVARCQFRNCWAGGQGGALHAGVPGLSVSDSIFVGNSATGGGAIWTDGGGFLTVSGSRFVSNDARSGYGGAILTATSGADSFIRDSSFFDNRSSSEGTVIQSNSALDGGIENCIVVRNNRYPGASSARYVFSLPGTTAADRCTLFGNAGPTGAGVHFNNSIIWEHGTVNSPTSYCDIQGLGGGTNFDLDPLFVDPLQDDFNVQGSSPCIGAGFEGSDVGAYLLLGFTDCDGNGIADASEMAANDCNADGIHDGCQIEDSDCNQNGILDSCDIINGFALDCNSDLIPDGCQVDCNDNLIPDDCDIANGTSFDFDSNGIPDECKPDCDGNGMPDFIEIFYATQLDCNGNAVPDDCEIADGTAGDCDSNSIPDDCDVANGATDCNGNLIPDDCDILTLDCNGNGVPDTCDIANGFSQDLDGNDFPDECKPDCNLNGVPDYLDIFYGTSIDCDGNGNPDECDPDCNGNGVNDECDVANGAPDCNNNLRPDVCDIADESSFDCDLSGVPDECEGATTGDDCNNNGILDSCEVDNETVPDCNGNGIPDECDIADGSSPDCNGDGRPDECDLADGSDFDCNGNGTLDSCDIDQGASPDCNGNSIPDECEEADGSENDCDGDSVLDSCELLAGTQADCDSDGYPDDCGIDDGLVPDCNGNGVPDSCDIAGRFSLDCNGNGIPDECDVAEGGSSFDCQDDGIPDDCQTDCNGNGIFDGCDILDLTSLDCDQNTVPDECDIANGAADCDEDGDLDTCEIILNPNLDLNNNTVLDDCECLFSNYCTALPNTTGLPGQIAYTGSAFCSFNDFTLIATDVPNNQFGVFYYGPNQTEQVFGEGYRCVGGQTTRLSVVNTGPLGFATSPIDNTEAPHNGQIDPGSTWNFQFWYRDPLGGPVGYNLTDALQVTFCE